jgi:aminopeptidase N
MFAAHLGIDTFLRGVSLHLKRHLYGNAESADLWAALSDAAKVDVADLMGEWMGKASRCFFFFLVNSSSSLNKLTQYTGDK